MSITVYEKPTSRDCVLSLERGSSITYEWFAIATAGETETQVMAAVEALTSYFYNGFDFLVLKNIKAKPRGGPYWEGTVDFGLPEGPSTGEQTNNSAGDAGDTPQPTDSNTLDNSFSFEVGGGTTHKVASILTLTQVVAPGNAIAPTNNMIGIDKNRINGVDIITPSFQFTRTQVFAALKWGYLKTLRFMVGTVNSFPFMGFEAGAVLLEGISGQYKAGSTSNPLGSWSLAFKFGVGVNEKQVKIGNIPAFNKGAWDYVWFSYIEQFDVTSGLTVQVPIAASVEQVYQYRNFARLGLTP